MTSKKERQGHGFAYERTFLNKCKNLQQCANYTSEYDAVCGDIMIQIKCIKHGCAIELGDYFRNKSKNSNFILVIGFWKGQKDNIVEEHIFLIDHSKFTSNLIYNDDTSMITEMRLISNLKSDDERWTNFCERHKEAYKKKNNKIDIRFKRDHKTQKRIQCAISWGSYNTWFKETFQEVSFEQLNDMINDINNKQDLSTTMAESTTQKTGLSRCTVDQYYTKPDIAKKYINKFTDIVNPCADDLVLEPSAGSGSFSDLLLEDGIKALCYDIEPKKPYIVQQNFLDLETSQFADVRVHCIGNPPFGRQSSLAKKFIKKCCTFSESVSFILPKSFKKPSFDKVFPLNFHKVFEEDCPKNSFLVNDVEYDVPCVFQVWVKKNHQRAQEIQEEPNGYSFVKKDASPDLAVRRVGFYTGKAYVDHAGKNIQSHYFIKFENQLDVNSFIEQFNKLELEFNNTVGARSISKTEVIKLINAQLENPVNT